MRCVNLESHLKESSLNVAVYISLADIIRKHGLLYHLYSDDCQIQVSFKSSPDEVSAALAKLEDCASEIYAWMACYKLKLNRERVFK